MASDGEKMLVLARKHVGERYILGSMAPKNNASWRGPWDCAEFASWLVYQVGTTLYGCDKNSGDPAKADAYTGYWGRDAKKLGIRVSVADAARTPGAAVLRLPGTSIGGHIVLSDGKGGTVEAHSSQRGVIESSLANRHWDMGVLVPGLSYIQTTSTPIVTPPSTMIYRLKKPFMKDAVVRKIQQALKNAGFSPGPIDGEFGPMTHAAVVAFQIAHGEVADGQVGPNTAKVLGVALPAA